jgi:putative ABC transport system substrate-binding protein
MPNAITRRRAILGAGAAMLVPHAGLAQQARKVPRVGVLHPGLPPPSPALYLLVAFQKGMRDLGYVEGRNIAFEYRYAGGKPEALPSLAMELVNQKVDVLLAISPASTAAARAVAGTTPMVVIDTQVDPVASGLVASLAKPGGSITGLFFDFGELMGKMLGLLHESVPGLRRAAVLWDTASGQFRSQFDALNAAARKLSIALDVSEWKQPSELEAVLDSMLKKRPHALIQLPSPNLSQASARIAKFTVANRVPSISIFPSFPEAGGLMSYGPDLAAFFGSIAPLVDKILKGARPGDLPIERPTTFEFVVNLKTAKGLNLRIPQTVLLQATKVIE